MTKFLLAACVLFAASSIAHASAVVSNVSYTSNSITFTETGNMSGYATPGISDEIGIVYTGNLFDFAGSTQNDANSISGTYFGNDAFTSKGYTVTYDNVDYTWSMLASPINNADVFTGAPITISWASPTLNTAGSGTLEFVWGNGIGGYTILNSKTVVNGRVNGTSVPEPGSLAILGLGLAGVAVARRKAKQ